MMGTVFAVRLRRFAVMAAAALLAVSTAAAALPNDSAYSALLADHVADGRVDYRRLRADRRLADYLAALATVDPTTLPAPARKAFLINAYNAWTLKVVCDAYPIGSIKDLKNDRGQAVWDWPVVRLGNGTWSLNQIEHTMLRPMGDARIHFAVVCAAVSCPPLRAEAYRADRLEAQLDDQGRRFLRNRTLNVVDLAAHTARLSAIFTWYASDFGTDTTTVLRTVAPFFAEAERTALRTRTSMFTWTSMEYDWRLNDR